MIRVFLSRKIVVCFGCNRPRFIDSNHVCDNLDQQFQRWLETPEGKVAEFDAENDRDNGRI